MIVPRSCPVKNKKEWIEYSSSFHVSRCLNSGVVIVLASFSLPTLVLHHGDDESTDVSMRNMFGHATCNTSETPISDHFLLLQG